MDPHSKVDQTKPSGRKKRVVFTVTNELTYDQRMIRICTTLSQNGYDVLLIGRTIKGCPPLTAMCFRQKRIHCLFQKGFFFYAEFNVRLLLHLLFIQMDIIGAIDLDTILPCLLVSTLKKTDRLYDAHELFCEMKEISGRPKVYRIWKFIERLSVPHFPHGYTVNQPIAQEFNRLYGVKYEVVKNVPFEDTTPPLRADQKSEKLLLYQGAVNEGRSFETLIPAMQWVNAPLLIFGDGNFMEQTKELVRKFGLHSKVLFKGKVPPDTLRSYTRTAWAGITLFDPEGKSNYYSLANRFFDYVQAGIPQLCVDFPVYRAMNAEYPVAVLVKELHAESLAKELNSLLNDVHLHDRLSQNCMQARKVWNWSTEERKVIDFFKRHFEKS